MARFRAAGSAWEQHHASLQQANNEPLDPRPPDIDAIDPVAARRGLLPNRDLDRLANDRHRIEPSVAENPGGWLAESSGDFAEAVDSDLSRDRAEEREIGDAAQQATEQAVATAGSDAIAFYLPITFYGPRHYGIYIRQNRFFGFCAMVQKYAPRVPWHEVTASALQFLLHHEAYHAAVELSCLVGDDFHERQLARTYRNYFDLATGPWRHAHRGLVAPYRCPEEQLAQHAGLSNMPRDASGEAIRSALIQITQTGPADYLYDPAAWPRTGKAKKPQAALEQALHRVQGTCLLRQPPPAAFDDIHVGIEPQAWFPPSDSRAVLNATFGIMPVYVIDCVRNVAIRFARACSLGNIPMEDFIRAVCRKCDVTHDKKGGKHPRLVVGEKKDKVTYPRSARTTPLYVIKQVADLLKLSKEDLIARCQL
jgi:hypothetical protein